VIGKLFAVGNAAPYRHPKVWVREEADDGERLRIGAGIGTIELLSDLAELLREPLFLQVVMREPQVGEAGRLESVALTHPELTRFTRRFGDLFADDARAQLWIGELDGIGLLGLDEHDLIYAYGALDTFERALRERGYTTGDPEVPDPHMHGTSKQFDKLEEDLRQLWTWSRVTPLD